MELEKIARPVILLAIDNAKTILSEHIEQINQELTAKKKRDKSSRNDRNDIEKDKTLPSLGSVSFADEELLESIGLDKNISENEKFQIPKYEHSKPFSNRKVKDFTEEKLFELNRLEKNSRVSGELNISEEKIISHIIQHQSFIKRWASEVNFRDLKKSKKLLSSYVELDTYLMPRNTHIDNSERSQKRHLLQTLLSEERHAIVIGTPGAGKSTSMKKLCSLFFENTYNNQCKFPLVVRFRTIDESESATPLRDEILKVIPFELSIVEANIKELTKINDDVFASFIDSLGILIILEGFDELPNSSLKTKIFGEIRYLVSRLINTRLVITCRTGEFPYSLDGTDVYEIAPLNEEQIKEFSRKWLNERAEKFILEITDSPYFDTMIRPLSLAHLCAIYDRIGRIPDRPKTVYKKVVSLLLDEWDEQRSIERLSSYAKFETDRKFEFLCHLAFELTSKGIRGEFSDKQLTAAYLIICNNFGLSNSASECKSVVKEIESHTGLFIKSGFELFEFAHKSIQEYLTAEYLVKLPTLRNVSNKIESFGSELAIATSISSNPSLYFSDLVLSTFPKSHITRPFYDAFISRLLIERPDFYSDDSFVLSFFYILSHSVTESSIHEDFFKLMKNVLSEEDMKVLSQYYTLKGRNAVKGTISVKRIKNHDFYNLKSEMKFKSMYDKISRIVDNH